MAASDQTIANTFHMSEAIQSIDLPGDESRRVHHVPQVWYTNTFHSLEEIQSNASTFGFVAAPVIEGGSVGRLSVDNTWEEIQLINMLEEIQSINMWEQIQSITSTLGFFAAPVRVGGSWGRLSERMVSERLKTRAANEEDKDEICVVCQDDLCEQDLNEDDADESIATLDCGHEYHVHCIKTWLGEKNVCPLCNATALPQR